MHNRVADATFFVIDQGRDVAGRHVELAEFASEAVGDAFAAVIKGRRVGSFERAVGIVTEIRVPMPVGCQLSHGEDDVAVLLERSSPRPILPIRRCHSRRRRTDDPTCHGG